MSRCNTCGAEIKWIRMQSGKNMPVDAHPIPYRASYKLGETLATLVTEDGLVVHGVVDPAADQVGYVSHFATCPFASAHRKKSGI